MAISPVFNREAIVPELPEVETTRRGISPHVRGRVVTEVVVRNAQLRWPVPAELAAAVVGNSVAAIERRGKYLLLSVGGGTALWHLGMSGSLRVIADGAAPGKHDHVDWLLDSGAILRFNDPRKFGALLWTEAPVAEHPLLAHLGPEPLSDAFDADYLWARTRRRAAPIKTFIMDARVVVGVGNIYANEALFMSGIRPTRAAGKLTRADCVRLVETIKMILAHAIERGGTTLRDFVGGDGKPGYFQQELKVYDRGGLACRTCERVLIEERLGQRQTVYCRQCQR